MTRHRIPVRVGTKPVSTRTVYQEVPVERPRRRSGDPTLESDGRPQAIEEEQGAGTEGAPSSYSECKKNKDQATWQDRALRLQAEMDNYRKRQRRLAREEAQAEQERLLRDVLSVADNLDRTLAAAPQGGGDGLRQGVELTRDELLRVLANHGLERFEALGEPFDPAWHEAVHVVSARALGVEPGTVVEQLQSGYRRHEAGHGERLFRPAQVVVAN